MEDFFLSTAPFWYTLSASILGAVFIWIARTYFKERKKQIREFRYLNLLVIASVHASEKVVGQKWADEKNQKFNELNDRDDFIDR